MALSTRARHSVCLALRVIGPLAPFYESAFMDIVKQLAPVAKKAGAVLLEMELNDLNCRYKAPGELVTRADRISHEIISRELALRFPDVPLVMEEQENPAVLPSTYIVVDELDGTAIYANGMDQWGISIAYIKDGRPIAGVIYQPARDVTLETEIEQGSWLNGERICLRQDQEMSNGIVGVEINRFHTEDERAWMCRLASNSLAIRSLSTAVGNAIELLSGCTVLNVNCRGGKVWDFAAAILAVEEAEGVALNCDGRELEWSQIPMSVMMATNYSLLETALSLKTPPSGE